MKICILDADPAVGEVDGFLFRRKEATVPVCRKHFLEAKAWELFAQGPVRDHLGKALRAMGIPKGAIPRIKARVK